MDNPLNILLHVVKSLIQTALIIKFLEYSKFMEQLFSEILLLFKYISSGHRIFPELIIVFSPTSPNISNFISENDNVNILFCL